MLPDSLLLLLLLLTAPPPPLILSMPTWKGIHGCVKSVLKSFGKYFTYSSVNDLGERS